MGKLFRSLGAARKNDLAPKCSFVVSLVYTGDMKTRLGAGTWQGKTVPVPGGHFVVVVFIATGP